MAIRISAAQSPKTPNGEPFDYLFVDSIVLVRDRLTAVWTAEIKYVVSMKSQDGSYLTVKDSNILRIPNFEQHAMQRYLAGFMAAAQADAALQIGIADAIAATNPRFSSAYYQA